MELKVRKSGDDLLVVIPDELAASLGWGPGDILAAEVVNEGVKIVRVETAFDHTMKIARDIMEENREVLATLAKT
jgi:putative addiction module antidote